MDRPIGMFDSGFGGLTVARALIDLLPAENLVYVGDTGRYPYGSKPQLEVAEFATQIGRYLVDEHDVKVVVVACNTAASAIDLANILSVPVVGVIEPGAQALVRATRSGRVGVIGTLGTVGSGSYQRAVRRYAEAADTDIDLECAACPGFVEFVERGVVAGEEVTVLAERLLAPVQQAAVDTLLLGCTHYPYLARVIADVMGPEVVLVSSADETALAVRQLLIGQDLADRSSRPGLHRFLSSGDVDAFVRLGSVLLGPELAQAESVLFPRPAVSAMPNLGIRQQESEVS